MKLAHFTDLHLRVSIPGTAAMGKRRSREVFPKFAAALRRLKEHGVDLIAVTGDLLDAPGFLADGIPRGFEMPGADQWDAWVRNDYFAIRALLEETGLPSVPRC